MFSSIAAHLENIKPWIKINLIASSLPVYLYPGTKNLILFKEFKFSQKIIHDPQDMYKDYLTNKKFEAIFIVPLSDDTTLELTLEGKGKIYTFYSGFVSEASTLNYMNHGEYINYYKNGAIFKKTNWINDKKNGKEIFYYKNGQIKRESNYINDEKSGDEIFYDKEGKVVAIVHY